jgi:hypothetical protein
MGGVVLCSPALCAPFAESLWGCVVVEVVEVVE